MISTFITKSGRLLTLKGERVAVREMRKHAAWYLKGLKGNGKVRNQINQTDSKEELEELLYDYVEQLEEKARVS
ncbi:hypothetical protein GI584_00630 [Gracilibacillus salitolerans]|uniref:DUS-like FMN-binding domain-containing protein n=1 Tax=Gracilibacillus salitolerans TaxID=2663022 RepID=A0A5Q2TD92_9BACI|nr:tRNA-dihydrouridine synthase [Gracilibacillus salitolerans]QGH32674.1 hypothetical protein GI584_00630 [Gracilibacillus salitolerans]